jgi:ADP-heptose:LPS heptosyltransferase
MRSVFLVKPSSLGDIVHTLPSLHALRQSLPDSRFFWVVNSEWSSLLLGNPDLAEVIAFPRQSFRGLMGASKFLRWCRQLGRYQPDLVLDFQGLLRSAWIARSTRGKVLLGLSDAREGARFFYRQTARVSAHQHSVERYLALASLAGASIPEKLHFELPAGRAIPNFELPDRFVVLHPFARGANKSLSPSEIYEVTRALAPLPVILVGRTDTDFRFALNAASLVNETDLLQLIWLLRRASFVVSVDSGPMHLAAAVSQRLLSIHFWSDPKQVGPYRPDAWIWQNGHICRVRDLPNTSTKPPSPARPHPIQIGAFVQERLLQTR